MVKEVKHYVEAVLQKYPFLTLSEINKILTYGLKYYAWVNKMHADVLICYRDKDALTAHCGPLGQDSLKHYYRFIIKNRMRERVLFYLKKEKWDGYYYIGLNDELHELVLRGKKYKTFKNVYLTKLKKELYHIPYITHIWRVPYLADCGWKFFIKKLKTDKAEYIGENLYGKYHQCFRQGNDE